MMQRWLERLRELAAKPEGLTVVCRTPATVRAVYRALWAGGSETGFAGLSVSTLRGLLSSVGPQQFVPDLEQQIAPALPGGHPWAARLEARPELTRALRRRMVRVHEHALAGGDLAGVSDEVRALVEQG